MGYDPEYPRIRPGDIYVYSFGNMYRAELFCIRDVLGHPIEDSGKFRGSGGTPAEAIGQVLINAKFVEDID